MPINAAPEHLRFVQGQLGRFLPGRLVWVFGSRVQGRARPHSDLDLAVMGDERIPLRTMAELRAALDDSPLPFAVDIVEWAALAPPFRVIVEKDHVVLPGLS